MSTTPSTSPPRTPVDPRPSSRHNTPNSDDSSIIDDLSFDYGFDENGNFIRLSKGGRRHSSPVTPPDTAKPNEASPESPKESSPAPAASPLARTSLTRSESASELLLGGTNHVPIVENKPLRTFQRVTSGPVNSLASTQPQPSYLAPTIASQRARMGPRRVTMEDSRDRPEAYAAARTRLTLDASANSYALNEEKENINGETSAIEERQPAGLVTRRNSPPLHGRSVASRMSSIRASYSTNPRPLSDVPVPQRAPTSRQTQPGLNRPGRIMKAPSALKYSTSNVERLGEVTESEAAPSENEYQGPIGGEDTEPEDEPAEPAQIPPSNSALPPNGMRQRRDLNLNNAAASSLSMSNSNRPRRSASLSDALHHDDYQLQVAHPPQSQHLNSRPGTALGLNGDAGLGARRVAPEERERQEQEARAAEYRKYRREEDIVDESRQARQSPSPTHSLKGQQAQRPTYGHRRRDSDTLRGLAGPSGLNSPTVMDNQAARPSPTAAARHGRLSPSTRGRISPPTAKGRASPSAPKGRLSPPEPKDKGRLSPQTSNRLATAAPKHKRSPSGTVLDPAAAHALMANTPREKNEEREREREREYEREKRERREQQQQQPVQQVPQAYSQMPPPQAPAPAPPQPVPNQLNRHIVVNKKAYARLDMIGKGGSSRVFRVLNHANELYAIKRVSLDKTDTETMSGYMNEIALLKRLEGNSRIIRLIDSEVKAGPGGSKGHLLLVMECGEVDLARLLSEQMRERLNMVWVAYYWQQMLQAVHVIHEEKIVHSDLKPANFVLVRGQLKLIDFGIANAIANDTTNIQRDHQIGTVNYMSPEAIELPDGMRRLKVGRPSDVWSLGCILYQMVYGHPPFQHLSVYQKMKAIPDISHVIDFPEYSVPSIPAKPSPTGQPQQPKRLEHLKKRVPKGVIDSMKSCLCRTSKERATIPQLLEQEWMAGPTEEKEKEKPKNDIAEFLGPQETVINPYYMRQLLEYGMSMGRNQGNLDPEAMLKEAERLVAELRAVQTGGSSSG